MTTKEKIEVMQAHDRGETIQSRANYASKWHDIEDPMFNWEHCEYRVKPKPLTLWVNIPALGMSASAGVAWDSKEKAEKDSKDYPQWTRRIVKMVEAPDEN